MNNTEPYTKYMQRCLQLAESGLGSTRSNPMVGCVIVHNHKIIGEGFHTAFGKPHAEVEAIKSVKDKTVLRESVLYVNFEPCAHIGKTPPCTDLVIASNIKHVVIASKDPNPLVNGKGIEKLRQAGIDVTVGILDEVNRKLNKRFFTFHEQKRPYIVLKWAQSKDGWIAPLHQQERVKLTCGTADILVHKWRAEEMAILVGKNTVQKDDPLLTVRHIVGINPIRLVFDPNTKIESPKQVFNNEAETWVFNCTTNSQTKNVKWIQVKSETFLQDVFAQCVAYNINSILVEGGLHTLQQFIKTNNWDEARIFECPMFLHEGIPAPYITGQKIESTKVGTDTLTILKR